MHCVYIYIQRERDIHIHIYTYSLLNVAGGFPQGTAPYHFSVQRFHNSGSTSLGKELLLRQFLRTQRWLVWAGEGVQSKAGGEGTEKHYIYIYIYIYDICIYLSIYISIYLSICAYVCMYVCIHVCIHVCVYTYMYVCMYVSMYVCIYIYMYILIVPEVPNRSLFFRTPP